MSADCAPGEGDFCLDRACGGMLLSGPGESRICGACGRPAPELLVAVKLPGGQVE